MRSVGIYPGTFDPIHTGHIAFAQAAYDKFGFDAIYFLPENTPRNKHNVRDIGERVRMINDAVSPSPDLKVMKLQSSKFTIDDTLPEIETRFLQHQFALLVGSDVAMNLAKWKSLEQMFPRWQLIIGLRRNTTEEEVRLALEPAEAIIGNPIEVSFIRTAYAHVSSSAMYTEDDLA